MNRNVHSYRCECSFAIHHAITLKFSKKKKMILEFLCDIHTVSQSTQFQRENLSLMTMCHKDWNFHLFIPSQSLFFAHQPKELGERFSVNFNASSSQNRYYYSRYSYAARWNMNKWFVGDILWILWVMLSLTLSLRPPTDANHDVTEEISICRYIFFPSLLQWFLSSIDPIKDCKSLLTCENKSAPNWWHR